MIKLATGQTDSVLATHHRSRHTNSKDLIHKAKTESDVRHGVLTLYDLDMFGTLEKHRIDYSHPELLLEFKLNGNYLNLASRCKCMAQLLHYVHQGPFKRGEHLFPDNLGLVDKHHIFLFNMIDFSRYVIDSKYFAGIQKPSSSHELLERELSWDANMKVPHFNIVTQYTEVWDELEKRGVYNNEHLRR